MYVDDSDLVEPIHAESFFSVASSGEIHERLSFEYLDPEGHYRTVISDEDLLSNEIRKLSTNMQHFLDLERVEINSERVASIVRYTDILKLHPGGNKIQTCLEIESAPYDFEIIWRFPVGTQIVDIDTKLEYDIYRDLVVLWAEEGMEVGGYELMEFILPEFPLDTRVKSNDSV